MDSDPPAAADTVTRLNRRLDELQAHQRGVRWTLLLLSLALTTMILLFGYGLYRSVTTNLAVDKLQPVLMDRVAFYTPQLQRKATEAVTLALPTYQELGSARLGEITPQLRSGLQSQFDTLPEAIRLRLDGRLREMQARIEADVAVQIKERFGDIPPEQVELLAGRLSDRVLDAGGGIQNDLEDKYTQQKVRVQQVLEKFDLPTAGKMTAGELQLKVVENAALLVVYLARNPDELPVMPDLSEGLGTGLPSPGSAATPSDSANDTPEGSTR